VHVINVCLSGELNNLSTGEDITIAGFALQIAVLIDFGEIRFGPSRLVRTPRKLTRRKPDGKTRLPRENTWKKVSGLHTNLISRNSKAN
jgi:hypothetical protein